MDTFFSPAKINLVLAVHQRLNSGYHGLSSLITALDFGDDIEVSLINSKKDIIECNDNSVPLNNENLILKAMSILRGEIGLDKYFLFKLNKRIPLGAGYGGGSSNAVTALKAVLSISRIQLSDEKLVKIVSKVGSDCSFFINPVPSIMYGKGEKIKPISKELRKHISSKKVVIFKPQLSISTKSAYQMLNKDYFINEKTFNDLLENFSESLNFEKLLFNSFSKPIGTKYLNLNCLISDLNKHGIPTLLSGSGSGSFSLLVNESIDNPEIFIKEKVTNAFGSDAFFCKANIL